MNFEEYRVELKKSFAKDSQYIFNAFVMALLVMALLFTFQPYLGGGDPKLAEIKKLDSSIVVVHPLDMEKLVQSKTGKPVMLVMYASWCGYCKTLMPMLVEMLRNHELDKIEPVFLSLDDQPRLLSKYLVHNGYDNAFVPYRLDRQFSYRGISQFVSESGSHYKGAIPYVGFFSNDGKLISDASGIVDKEDVLLIAKQL